MSSVSKLAALAVLSAAGVYAAACSQPQAQVDSAVAPAVQSAPVGPLPGPAEYQPATRNPFTGDKAALHEGRRIFTAYNCAGCHGEHGGGGMGPSLRDESWLFGSSDEQVAQSIAEGRAHGMPAWRQMLTPAQVWQVAAYIKSMRTDHEPDRPQ